MAGMDRRHPLLDRLEATHSPSSLKAIARSILRSAWPAVTDVGDAHYDLVADLLPLSTAPQLAALEDASPHLQPYTNHLWRTLAINEFIDVRKAVEDARLAPEDEPASWREQYAREERRRDDKMGELIGRMRGQLKDYKEGRKTIERVDGVQLARRRKAGASSPRPKTLFEKARSNTKAITSIYAPRRRTVPAPARPAASVPPRPSPSPSLARSPPPPPPHAFATAPSPLDSAPRRPSASGPSTSSSSRPLKRPSSALDAPPPASLLPSKRSALSPPASASTSRTPSAPSSRHASFSPPPPPAASAPSPPARSGAASPPPPPPPPPGNPRKRPLVTTVTRTVTVKRPAPAPPDGRGGSFSPPPASASALSPVRPLSTHPITRARPVPPPPPPPPPPPLPPSAGAASAPPPPAAAALAGRTPSVRAVSGLFMPKKRG
ncbi:hypothetical protein JCM10449v2_001616 [Rhodotorula kratochvilovae]